MYIFIGISCTQSSQDSDFTLNVLSVSWKYAHTLRYTVSFYTHKMLHTLTVITVQWNRTWLLYSVVCRGWGRTDLPQSLKNLLPFTETLYKRVQASAGIKFPVVLNNRRWNSLSTVSAYSQLESGLIGPARDQSLSLQHVSLPHKVQISLPNEGHEYMSKLYWEGKHMYVIVLWHTPVTFTVTRLEAGMITNTNVHVYSHQSIMVSAVESTNTAH